MTIISRQRVLGAKIETTSGTAESLAGSDASFNAYNVKIQQGIKFESREAQGGFGELSAVTGAYLGKATFRTDCGWDGTATEPSWADTFLPGCGIVKSAQVFTPRTEPVGSNVKTLTIGCWIGGKFKGIRGAAGTGKLVCKTGDMAYIDWEFTGIWIPPTDVALVSPAYPTPLPLRYASSTTTWNSVALCLENLTLDFGNTVTMRLCATDVSGYHAAMVTNRKPKVTGNPEAKLVATQDRYGQLLAMTEGILTWGLDGPTTSVLTIAAPKAQIVNIQEGDREGLVTDEIEWQLNKNGSTVDQEFSITFTNA